MGDYAQARRNLMAALVIYPTDRYSMFLIARTYYQDGNHSLADSWMVNAINNQPIPQLQGQWWLQLGNWRLEWHNCSSAQDAYIIASNAGVDKATISEKLITLAEVCNP